QRSRLGAQPARRHRHHRLARSQDPAPARGHRHAMPDHSRSDPAVYLAMPVWLCAAIVFPLQIGVTGAPFGSLVLYLAAAGALLSLADALHDPPSYGNWQVATFEWILQVLGLALPGALAFAFGTLVAPAEPIFEPVLCEAAEACG